ncbi:MAG: bifunctional diguanylate cyclase/phosphodiesterase [Halioglobus sp.]|nr:bifunctional diguanylate cyclase/phosphodiesterase [Halioglobus sp.]
MQLPGIEREQFIRHLGVAAGEARAGQTHLGLMLIDITNLARINHYHGYEAGDRVLQQAYSQLVALSKLPHAVFRVGSHRFSFILADLGNPAFIALAMNRVQRALAAELHRDAGVLGADIKIGIAINRHGGLDFMTLLARAEASLSQAKLGSAQRIEDVLAEDSDGPVQIRLEQSLAEALQDNAFELYFQPKIELATGRVLSAEALLRWQTPGGEFVAPEIIVRWAESSGRSYDLTKWVVHRALRQLREWQGSMDISVAVNVPANLAGERDLPALLHDAIAIWGVKPDRVVVEITESAIIEDKESGFDNLLKLREMGVTLSIDDFGTGYSSLSYFKHIPAAELKIDKSFVDSMLVDAQDMELVKIIIHIAHQFGLRVVAEGVEDRQSLEKLRELGCDYAQGYYISRPLPQDKFEAWVAGWRGLDG